MSSRVVAVALAAILCSPGCVAKQAMDEYNLTLGQVVSYLPTLVWWQLKCAIVDCTPAAPEGIELFEFDASLLESVPIAIEVDPFGRVFVAESDRVWGGVEDNRFHRYWLLDDLAARTVQDRVAYYEKWAERGKLVAVLGGEHTVAIGAVKALRETHPNLSVLYLDAHADLQDRYMGTRWGHASVARRIGEMCPVVEVGVRSMSLEESSFIRESNLPVHLWPHAERSLQALADRVLESLTPLIYVSVDLDVLDPSIMAAVGTPEPGGMSWAEVTGLLAAIAQHRKIVGFDLTEPSPGEGPEACAFAAATLAYKIIGYATAP